MKYHYIIQTENDDTGTSIRHTSDRPLTAAEVFDALGPAHVTNHDISKQGLKCIVKLTHIESDIPPKVRKYVESVAHLGPEDKTLAVSAVAYMLDCNWYKAKEVIKEVLDVEGAPKFVGPYKEKTANFLRCVKSRWVAQRWLITEAVVTMEGGLYTETIKRITQFYASDTADSPQD